MTDIAKMARRIRRLAGTPLTKVLEHVVTVLADAEIPSIVVGGYSVQEHGYARFTEDLDLVVTDVIEAATVLLDQPGFHRPAGSLPAQSTVISLKYKSMTIDLIQAGATVSPKSVIPHPHPTTVSHIPIIVALPKLIELKLSAYLSQPIGRAKDMADVVELIKANSLPLNLPLDHRVRDTYQHIWQGLHSE